jgi:hypothetical protein
MEVHHPHYITHKKKWSEYFVEFIMLFLAVFLGFIAENIRENISEHKHAKEMAVSLIDDLKHDTTEIHNATMRLQIVCNDADSVMIELDKPRSVRNDTLLLYLTNELRHYDFFDPQTGTYEQIKSSGALRYFPQALASKMSNYESYKNYMAKLTDGDLIYYRTLLLPFCEKISNPRFLKALQNNKQYNGTCFNPPLNNETEDMLYKHADHIKVAYEWQIGLMGAHEKQAINLINALQKEYRLQSE